MKAAVDAVVFAYKEEKLFILLIKRKFDPFANFYSLPGGFIQEKESAEDAVKRELSEETGIVVDYLEQLYTFTDIDRDPRERIISLAYYGLVNPQKLVIVKGNEALSVEWIEINSLNEIKLAFDHKKIINYALFRLRNKIRYEPIGFELLPEKFTLAQLYALYKAITDVDKRNLYKQIKKSGLLINTGLKQQTKTKKAMIFRFNIEKYYDLKIKGLSFKL